MKRRAFLKQAAFTPALCQFIGSAIGVGFVSKANANASGTPPRNFLSVWVKGGSWATAFDYMPGVMNGISEGRKLSGRDATSFNQLAEGGELKTNYIPISVKAWGNQVTANLPPVWGNSVRLGNGNTVPLKNLLDGMAVFQGIRCPVDGHGIVDPHWYNPLGTVSLHGALAALSRRTGTAAGPIAPAFSSLGKPKGFADPGKQESLDIETIRDLLEPTVRKSSPFESNQMSDYLSRRGAMEETMNAALKVFGTYYAVRLPGSEALFEARSQAEIYLKKNFDSIFAYFDEALLRYTRVANDATSSYQTSKVWIVEGDRAKKISSAPFNSGHMAIPVRNTPQFGQLTSSIGDLANCSPSGDGGAQIFAMAETLFVHGISAVYAGEISGGFNVDNWGHGGDAHFSGLIPQMIGVLAYQHQFAALLSEFKRKLSDTGMWDNTVVQWAGEFNRSPRLDGTGADHGWEGSVTSVFSGAIDGFSAVGNLLRGDQTWGKAGLTEIGGEAGGVESRYLLLEDVIASLSHLGRLPRNEWPNPRGVSIFDSKGDKLQTSSRMKWSKIVA